MTSLILRKISISEEDWFVLKDICKILEITNSTEVSRVVNASDKTKIMVDSISGAQNTLVVNITGLKKILTYTRSIYVSKVINTIKEQYNLDINLDVIFSCMEASTLSIIKESFKHLKSYTQYQVDKYRIDLYFTEHRIAIECDENNHKDYKNDPERQKYIEEKLNCTFIRYNPSVRFFNVGVVINQIIHCIEFRKERKCLYIASITESDKIYYHIVSTVDIFDSIKRYKKTIPMYKVEFLVYLEDNEHLEINLNMKFRLNIIDGYIFEVPLERLISASKFFIKHLNLDISYVENLSIFNNF